jgi:hypothetical protein
MKPYALAMLLVCFTAVVPAQKRLETMGQDAALETTGEDALAAIDACVAKLDAELDVGYGRIARRCPRLARALEQSGWAEWLPRGWKEARNELSAGSLIELRTLVARELEAPLGSRRPDVKLLNAVLTDLGPTARQRDSLWDRFRAWLRTVVARNEPAEPRSWLDDLATTGRSQAVIDRVTYIALGFVVVLAGVIVVGEMRAAGLLRSRRRAAAEGPVLESPRTTHASWRDVERAAHAEKPRMLLELVIARLTESRRVPPAAALTVRELTHSVDLADAADRDRLREIALAAERARYSIEDLSPDKVNTLVEQGRELLSHLQGSSAS